MTRTNVVAGSTSQFSLRRKLWVVGALYFAEGVPYGFINITLSVYFRSQGMPLAADRLPQHFGVGLEPQAFLGAAGGSLRPTGRLDRAGPTPVRRWHAAGPLV